MNFYSKFLWKKQLFKPLDGYYARYRKHIISLEKSSAQIPDSNFKEFANDEKNNLETSQNHDFKMFQVKTQNDSGQTNAGYEDEDSLKLKKSYSTFENESNRKI